MVRRSDRALIRSADLSTARGQPVRLASRIRTDEDRSRWTARLEDPDGMVVLDLFCGAGGMSLGFERAGFAVATGIDNNWAASETFAANFLAPAVTVDVATVPDPVRLLDELGIPRIDVVVGGPPCQGFSQVGLAKVRSLSPELRERIYARNRLYEEFVRFVEALRPLLFVMENVPHLGSFADGLIAREIQEDFAAVGYQVYRPLLLDASNYGVPQYRRRLFFVGSRIGWVFRPPRPTHGVTTPRRTLAHAIGDLPPLEAPSWDEDIEYVPRTRPEFGVPGEYAALMRSAMPPDQRTRLFDHIARAVREDDAEIFRSMRPGGTYDEVDAAYRRYELKAGADGDVHFPDRYYKLRWDEPCGTITAHMAKDGYRYIYPDDGQTRTLSLREAARVQSFPDNFRFAGYRTNRFVQVGNAVPPLLAETLGRSVARAVRGYRTGQLEEHEWQPPLPLPDLEQVPAEVGSS